MEIYHVLNRGVEKRNVFLDEKDKLRFVQNLYLLNNKKQAVSTTRKYGGIREKNAAIDLKREELVHIHAYCLMPNHYHILLSPINNESGNISLFMQKINMAYAKYFNEKYSRSGYLWQGKYKRILIKNDSHFLYIPYYIHLNPLDLKYSEWRNGKVKDALSALKYLQEYKWSSCLDYLGYKNFSSLITMNFLREILGSEKTQKQKIIDIITSQELSRDSTSLE